MRPWFAISLAAVTLAACETPTVYGPVARPGASGYVESKIQSDRYRVTFRGGSDANRNRVADLTMLRAAQITLDAGYDWFRVTDRYGEVHPPRGPVLSLGGGTASYGRHSAVGFGADVGGIPLGGGPIISETVEIQLGKGPVPKEPDVYDAQSVRSAIRP